MQCDNITFNYVAVINDNKPLRLWQTRVVHLQVVVMFTMLFILINSEYTHKVKK